MRLGPTLRRCAAGAALTAATVVSLADPASAHTLSGVQATNYRSRITAVAPAVPGLSVRLLDLGRKVQVTNRSAQTVLILGYQNEPYLRVGPAGTFVNRKAPSYFLNRQASTATLRSVPKAYSATANPIWFRTGSGRTVTWPDRRTRQEGSDPPAVAANRGRQVAVSTWNLAMAHGGAPVTVTGSITYVPPPNGWGWLAVTVAALAVTAALGLLGRWHLAIAAALSLVVALNVVDAVGSAAISGGSGWALALRVLPSLPVWLLAIFSVAAVERQSEGGLVAAAVVGFLVAAFNGLGGVSSLVRSQVPFAWDANLSRLATALALGIGFGALGAVAVVFRRFGAAWTAAALEAEQGKQSGTPGSAARRRT